MTHAIVGYCYNVNFMNSLNSPSQVLVIFLLAETKVKLCLLCFLKIPSGNDTDVANLFLNFL